MTDTILDFILGFIQFLLACLLAIGIFVLIAVVMIALYPLVILYYAGTYGVEIWKEVYNG